ncbi:MAG: ABC transporter ATP-binding protein [Pseudomonadota bacterium]
MLNVAGIETWYGESQALFGVDLSVGAGELVALMGKNGMGKSTTIRSICQLTPPRAGNIIFSGESLLGKPAYKIAQAGIGLVPEGRRCFSNLTVEENLRATARDGRWDVKKTVELFPRLGERTRQYANTLSGGEQQMLAIGRALMTNPRLLILDEATEGLAPVIRQEIWSAIAALMTEGLSILLVDKSLKEISQIANRCVILEKGVTVWQGSPDALTPEITDRFLGV